MTVRRVLCTESYTGRTFYRRTKRVKSSGQNGRGPSSQAVLQSRTEWTAVDGCTSSATRKATSFSAAGAFSHSSATNFMVIPSTVWLTA